VRRAFPLVFALLALSGTAAGEPDGYRLIESAAATVNGEVVFLSDVVREACFFRCGMVPGRAAEEITLSQAREKLIADALVLQEQTKLGLGSADNAAVADAMAKAVQAKEKCSSPCAGGITQKEIRELVLRRFLVRDFLDKRVGVFVEVNDEDVRREIVRRSRSGAPPEDLSEEKVRKELQEEKMAGDIRNWFARATSRSRIGLSPLGEP